MGRKYFNKRRKSCAYVAVSLTGVSKTSTTSKISESSDLTGQRRSEDEVCDIKNSNTFEPSAWFLYR